MYIDQEACVGCGLCVPYCPVGAISVSGRKAVIDADACVECSCCRRSRVCRKDAICQEELKMPRAVRSVMSDVFTIFEDTGVSGRGTEEMKTNEVTGRFKPGWVGMALEAGRPIAAATFRQVQEIAVALAGTGLVEFETCNPITQMMKDNRTGYFREDILDERVYSAILEFSVPVERLAGSWRSARRSPQRLRPYSAWMSPASRWAARTRPFGRSWRGPAFPCGPTAR